MGGCVRIFVSLRQYLFCHFQVLQYLFCMDCDTDYLFTILVKLKWFKVVMKLLFFKAASWFFFSPKSQSDYLFIDPPFHLVSRLSRGLYASIYNNHCACDNNVDSLSIDFLGVNECENNNGGCEQLCIDTYDGYCCMCRKGYKLIPLPTDCKGMDTIYLN